RRQAAKHPLVPTIMNDAPDRGRHPPLHLLEHSEPLYADAAAAPYSRFLWLAAECRLRPLTVQNSGRAACSRERDETGSSVQGRRARAISVAARAGVPA